MFFVRQHWALAWVLALSGGSLNWVNGQEPPAGSAALRWTNRLARTHSPYLLQHAHNPVDWYPWGEEAFARARAENKLIFLSIGYSTCHWCHVMERESFENLEVAAFLNEHFISIKVDREERPDVDAIYMGYVQAATGSGGWPMSVWLTPGLKPITGGTYFPPDQFKAILERIASSWQTEREEILRSSDSVLRQLQELVRLPASTNAPDEALLDKAYQQLSASFDATQGGFGRAPKFPRPCTLNFLLRYCVRTGKERARDMVLETLRHMARGGLHDQLGGGFHRYSTDERWFLPHFEKMLYDQAQLAGAYLDAYQLTHEAEWAAVARDTLDYVLRDLTGPQGQFYSAEDADSPVPGHPGQKGEGAFYVWEQTEIEQLLKGSTAEVFLYHYGVRPPGNVERDPQGEFPKKNVLWVAHSMAETSERFGPKAKDLLQTAREKVFAAREKRRRPLRDDKTLTSWNGLMISALARGYQVLEEPRYLDAAQRAARFVKNNLYRDGSLLRRARDGQADIGGLAEDYAFLIQGLLDLYEASLRWEWLDWARTLQARQDELFWDADGGGYFKTAPDAQNILLRLKEDYDGAEPAPSSVAALNLFRLAEMTGHEAWIRQGERTLRAFGERLSERPVAMPQLLVATEFHLRPPQQIILAGRRGAEDLRALLKIVRSEFRPNRVLLLADGGEGQAELAKSIPGMAEMVMRDGKATAYVCRDYRCQLPVTEPAKLEELLRAPAAK